MKGRAEERHLSGGTDLAASGMGIGPITRRARGDRNTKAPVPPKVTTSQEWLNHSPAGLGEAGVTGLISEGSRRNAIPSKSATSVFSTTTPPHTPPQNERKKLREMKGRTSASLKSA